MAQVFAEPGAIYKTDDGRTFIRVEGDDFHHLVRVLRLRVGEEFSVRLRDDTSSEYRFGVADIAGDLLTGELRFVKGDAQELPCRIWLFQGLPKADKLELVIQKAVELGAYSIVPVDMKRSVAHIDPAKAGRKRERWMSIAASAAEQARRAIEPVVFSPVSFQEAMDMLDREGIGIRLLPYELEAASSFDETRRTLESIRDEVIKGSGGSQIAVFIGPEGGFDTSEIERAREAGCRMLSMGPRILRTETAGLVMLSWLSLMLQE